MDGWKFRDDLVRHPWKWRAIGFCCGVLIGIMAVVIFMVT